MVIGKIPGYNSAINGRSNINYENRLINNLTITEFSPIGYSIDFFADQQNSIYRLGKNLDLLKKGNDTLKSADFNTQALNIVTTYSALNQWLQMQSGIGITNKIDSFKIVATNDSTITETLSNQYTDSYVEQLASKITDNKGLNALATGFTKVLPSLDTTAALGLLSTMSNAGNQVIGSSMYGQAASVLFGKMIGIQSAFPRIWDRSSYNNTTSLTIKLVSPSGHPADVEKFVIEPLKYLLLATSPVTFDGITYGFPPLWKVEAKGMASMKLAGITALSISRGGPDTIFNRFNQPTNIDVRLVVEPVVAGFATPMDINLTDTPDDNGYTKMIVQNPMSILNPMSNTGIKDTSIELKTLYLN